MPKLNFKQIIIFGDSISWGKGDLDKGGWPNRLKMSLYSKNEFVEVLDASVPGDTTRELVGRFSRETQVRNPNIIIFAIGINDSQYHKTPDNHKVELDEFEKNLNQLAKQARHFTDNIVFVGLSKVDESKTTPIYDITLTYYTNESIKTYDQKIKEVARANNLTYIPVFSLLEELDLPDGLHIAATGHQKIKNKVEEALLKEFDFLVYNEH